MKNTVLFFLVNPFLGFINAFRYFKQDWAKNSVWLFVIFYGFTMAKPEFADSTRYVTQLKTLNESESSWGAFVRTLFVLDERGQGSLDIYQPVVTYIVSLFTGNGDVLFAVFGAVFGFFYSRNSWLLLQTVSQKSMHWSLWLLFVAFLCVIGFWSLGGVRMWTAAHVFFYGVFLYLIQNKKAGLFIAAFSMLIHFSFMLPLAFLVFFIFVQPSFRLLFYLFLGSFFIAELNLSFVNTAIQTYAPEFIVPRVQNYANEEVAEGFFERKAMANWYVLLLNRALNWGILFLYGILYFRNRTKLVASKSWIKMFGFSLLLLIFGNLMAGVPSGSRFVLLAQLFALATIFLSCTLYEDLKLQRSLKWTSPIFIFFNIVSLRTSFDTVTVDTVFSNPLFAAVVKIGTPLIDWIK